jgi:hypothetical protein
MVSILATAQTPKAAVALYAPGPCEENEIQRPAHQDGDAINRA